uniref:Glycoprotein hormone alpha-2 n=1 Tax=Geotrypetes seraphini TaxID=260995 RepID=A0A6P8RVK9_GEOSA|nr:glycoprotein hormone alpha-2 isoform X2 [Geotrypetes seraphini]
MSNSASSAMSTLSLVLGLLLLVSESWNFEAIRPGCHLYPFNVTIQSNHQGTCRGTHKIHACVGYCESSAFPSKYSILLASGFKHNITSVSQCCTVSKLQKVKIVLHCSPERQEFIEIFTAKSCQCDMCRLSRY